jgi:hypothetical protein
VLSFMIGLLVVQILLVLFLGIEPKNRRLEDLEEIVRDVPVATPTQGRDFAE